MMTGHNEYNFILNFISMQLTHDDQSATYWLCQNAILIYVV